MKERLMIYSIGHSSRPLGEFIGLLQENGIRLVVDVRRYPSSRRFPYFSREDLRRALGKESIGYLWRGEVFGGRLHDPRPDSLNKGLKSPGFRAYADRMLTREFQKALKELLVLAASDPLVIMCAEALYFRCHRFLIADALFAWGVRVLHIIGPGRVTEHRLTKFAQIIGIGKVIYPGGSGREGGSFLGPSAP